ncbi:MAG TPA: medium chain dehydrogenase/reductase family protein [Candidatus Acidoferrales bacterium]|nr:medium chain dehydrogenase/reductase family protein [Candidatus Acidoferrales bacterium]
MRAMVVRKHGPPENFELRDWPAPAPKAGECLVRVRAVGINFADLLQRMGIYPGTPKPPFIPGFEVAGTVEQAPGATALRPGDRVVAMTRFDAYAELAVCTAEGTFVIPDGLSFAEAAAIPVNYLTAYHSMFEMGNLRAGDRVLIHGAAGGVGVAAVQLARARGLVTFGTAGTGKQDFLRKIGVDHPIDYTREDFVQPVRRAAPDGIEMVLDPIGGRSWAKSLRCLGTMGRLVVFGFSAAAGPSGKRSLPRAAKAFAQMPRLSPLKLMESNHAVIGVHLGRMRGREAVLRREMDDILALYSAGQIHPVVGKTFPLEQAAAAHRYIHDRQNVGKVVLTL